MFRHTAGLGTGLSSFMAGLTLGIVVSRLGARFCVRVVAGQAADARVVWVVASAAPEPVRLEANVIDTVVLSSHDV